MTDTGGRLLTEGETAYFMELESMFNSAGWSRLQKMLEDQIAGLPEQAFWYAKDYNEIELARTRIRELTALAQMPLIVEGQRENLIRERQTAVDDIMAAATASE